MAEDPKSKLDRLKEIAGRALNPTTESGKATKDYAVLGGELAAEILYPPAGIAIGAKDIYKGATTDDKVLMGIGALGLLPVAGPVMRRALKGVRGAGAKVAKATVEGLKNTTKAADPALAKKIDADTPPLEAPLPGPRYVPRREPPMPKEAPDEVLSMGSGKPPTPRVNISKREGVDVMRSSVYGNPFIVPKVFDRSPDYYKRKGFVRASSREDAIERYEAWVKGFADKDVLPKRRARVVSDIESGVLKGKTLKYFDPNAADSHAVRLARMIEEGFEKAKPPTKKPATKKSARQRLDELGEKVRDLNKTPKSPNVVRSIRYGRTPPPNKEYIVASRTRGRDFLKAFREDNSIGNPWDHRGMSLYKTKTPEEAVQNFDDWLNGRAFKDKLVRYRAEIIRNQGKLRGRKIMTPYRDVIRSHSDVLDEYLNKTTKGPRLEIPKDRKPTKRQLDTTKAAVAQALKRGKFKNRRGVTKEEIDKAVLKRTNAEKPVEPYRREIDSDIPFGLIPNVEEYIRKNPFADSAFDTGIKGMSRAQAETAYAKMRKATEACDFLAKNAKDPAYRAIAKKIRPYVGDSTRFNLLTEDNIQFAPDILFQGEGRYYAGLAQIKNTSPDEIWIRSEQVVNKRAKAGSNATTVLHELLHAATTRRFEDGMKAANANTALGKAARELDDLALKVSEELLLRADDLPEAYKDAILLRIANAPKELISYGLTETSLQAVLSDIKIPGTNKNALTEFVSLIRRLLGIGKEEETALTALIRATDDMLAAPLKDLPLRSYTDPNKFPIRYPGGD